MTIRKAERKDLSRIAEIFVFNNRAPDPVDAGRL